jgi:hypothetical protein
VVGAGEWARPMNSRCHRVAELRGREPHATMAMAMVKSGRIGKMVEQKGFEPRRKPGKP